MLGYSDIADLEEDNQIDLIGKTVMEQARSNRGEPYVAGVLVDDDGKKADRYIRKLKERFPSIRIVDQFKGPTPGAYTIKVGGPLG